MNLNGIKRARPQHQDEGVIHGRYDAYLLGEWKVETLGGGGGR